MGGGAALGVTPNLRDENVRIVFMCINFKNVHLFRFVIFGCLNFLYEEVLGCETFSPL